MNKRRDESSISLEKKDDHKDNNKKNISNLIPSHLQKSAFTKAIENVATTPKKTQTSTPPAKPKIIPPKPKPSPGKPKNIPARRKSMPIKRAKNNVVNENRYLIRSKIMADRKSRIDSMARNDMDNRYVNGNGVTRNKYVMPRTKRTIISRREKEKNKRDSDKKEKDKKNKENKEKEKKKLAGGAMYSGTIIYNGKNTLHPYKWSPSDPDNSPAHYKWDTLLPGTHVLDQNTCLTWIVNNKRGLDMAPCQTIKLAMDIPDNLDEFNPGLSLNPYLPESKQIPNGTRFLFNDTGNQVYLFNSHLQLQALAPTGIGGGTAEVGVPRPSQVIPIAINSLFNTNRLWGLNTPITHSELQTPSGPEGFTDLQEWFDSLIKGSEVRPGYLGKLPTLEQLQPYDVLDFYDPNMKLNPRINGLNPDGTTYIDQLHEGKFFHFRLQVINGDEDGNGGGNRGGGVGTTLSAREIIQPISPFICNISIPTANTNQDRPIYIRSATLIPHLGDPLKVVNQIERPYYFDSELDTDRFIEDFKNGLLQLGYPYEQIKISYLGENGDFYVVRFSNLPTHLWGIVLSSDQMPLNKYAGSGRFYLGYSANSQGITYEYKLDSELGGYSKDGLLSLENLSVHDVTVDGVLIKVSDSGTLSFNSNQQLGTLFNQINTKLGGIGYPGYVLGAWWNEYDHEFKFYLSGVVNNNLPNIMLNINNNLITLDFTV